MKKEDKKVPKSPERLFVGSFPKPIPDITNSSSFAAIKTWVGIKDKLMAEDDEYINLSHAWHKQSEMPKYMDETIVVADKDYMNPKIIDLEGVIKVLSKRGPNRNQQQMWDFIGTKVDFVYWAYYTCFIPSIAL